MRFPVVMLIFAGLGLGGCMNGATGNVVAGSSSPPTSGSVVVSADPFPDFGLAVNAYRAPAVNPLVFNSQLHAAAQSHATDMYTNGFFSHTGSDGSQPWDRVDATGYNWAWVGENIARGQTSADEALTAWQNSSGHNAILLSSEPTEFALAWEEGNHWVMVLARPN